MQLQFGTPTFRKTSKPLNKSNADQHITFLTTTQPEHQGALQAWSTNSSGKAFRQEEETTDSLYCIGSSMDWSIYIQTATYNRVTAEREGNIVSTQKELGVRPTVILLPKNNQGLEHATIWDNISADTGGIQGKPYCLPPSVQLLDCQLSMYIVLTDFKLYIYFGPLTTDTPEHVSAAGLITF